MDEKLQKLKDNGCSIDEALERTLNDEDFLLTCICSALESEEFNSLIVAIKNRDYKQAFIDTHTLKGVCANFGLTELYKKSSDMCELLRASKKADYDSLLKDLLESRDRLKNIIN